MYLRSQGFKARRVGSSHLEARLFHGATMTREDFRARWNARLTECATLGILVDGERFCREVLADFDAVIRADDDRLLSLADASEASGYWADHLRRLYRQAYLRVSVGGGGFSLGRLTFRGNRSRTAYGRSVTTTR